MATVLAHIRIKEGSEELWETTMKEMVEKTFANEPEAIRYEYWKGQEPRSYYGLLAFTSKHAFFIHQDAPYHRTPVFAEVIEDIKLEWVDPVEGASPLPHTENPPLPEDAPPGIAEWENMTPVELADWWVGRQ